MKYRAPFKGVLQEVISGRFGVDVRCRSIIRWSWVLYLDAGGTSKWASNKGLGGLA